jgi:hypothetical protein
MLVQLQRKKEYVLINWATHQVLSGCTDDAKTDLYVCKKTDEPAAIH